MIFQWESYGIAMASPWENHGISMMCPWCVYDVSMGLLWGSWRNPMGFLWCFLVLLNFFHVISIVCLCVFLWDSHWVLWYFYGIALEMQLKVNWNQFEINLKSNSNDLKVIRNQFKVIWKSIEINSISKWTQFRTKWNQL